MWFSIEQRKIERGIQIDICNRIAENTYPVGPFRFATTVALINIVFIFLGPAEIVIVKCDIGFLHK